MAESTRLVDLVQADLDDFLAAHRPVLARIAPELMPFIDFSDDLLRGGKRFRALFCYWGWQAAIGVADTFDPLGDHVVDAEAGFDLTPIIHTATALEVFHAAALVHDDIMDNSDTRRGRPAAHKRFEAMHEEGDFLGNAAVFGQSGALLLGDLLLAWSDELFDLGGRSLDSPERALAARVEFNLMRTEVTAGQFLDILDERSWQNYPEPELLERAHRVIVYKSAKYSIEAPLVIGAALAGATREQIEVLRRFGLPLGIAYQLRDDLLGVFGDPTVTGKPAGDDLREGKRTVLIAIARTLLATSSRRLLDELLGDEDLTAQQVVMVQASIEESGAVERVERIIDHNVGLALEALRDAPLSRASKDQLIELAQTVTRRTF